MPWTADQRQRLAKEKSTLEKYFPGKVVWLDPTENTMIEITMITNNERTYVLRVYIPPDYPNSLPIMVVRDSPEPMPNWISGRMTHSFGQNEDGHLVICHYRRDRWSPDRTLSDIVVKGRIWLEAYEAHLVTGEQMEYYLRAMQGLK
ncbi:Hypothetical predicted protein [Paramuricea clavata]|uniref:Uncharacterized protein n=1 Tax=Paramuricea clavata TaxID=317549 RepID=A0A6S7KH89_PARCT|nr:Hypothetical predicted protein [Paramuricea clavata]